MNVTASDTIGNLKGQIQCKEQIPPIMQRLVFRGKDLDDASSLLEIGLERESTSHILLRMRGGAGPKRKRESANPFDEEQQEYATIDDGQHWQQAFEHSVRVGVMTKEQLDVRTMLAAATGEQLDAVVLHLTTGKAHHNIKIDEVSEMIPFVMSMKRVISLIENSMSKFKRLMSAKLWQLGCSEAGAAFKMETLVAYVRGIRCLK